ncbi:MAG: N-acyl homoserine lactonase family protein [Gemmatimonadota bacterium]
METVAKGPDAEPKEAFPHGQRQIRRAAVISTGWGEAHREHVRGTRKPALWWIFAGRSWVRLPINVYVIEHSDGLILFDAGQDRAVVTDPDYWPDRVTAFFMRHIFRLRLGPEDTLTERLAAAGYEAGDVRMAVISHLHADHVGCIREIPQAELVVSAEAWQHMLGPHPEREMVLRRDIDIPGAKWRQITLPPTNDPTLAPFTRAYDLLGDASMMLLPTPGHLPGSLSMLVRSGGRPPLLLVGDLCYSVDMLMEGRLPGTGDRETLLESYSRVRALRERMPDLVILPSHDPEAAAALRTAYPDPGRY